MSSYAKSLFEGEGGRDHCVCMYARLRVYVALKWLRAWTLHYETRKGTMLVLDW